MRCPERRRDCDRIGSKVAGLRNLYTEAGRRAIW